MRTAPDGRETRRLGLRLRLQPQHFPAGRLTLRCSAAIASVYRQHADVTVRQTGDVTDRQTGDVTAGKRPQSPAKTLEIKGQSSKWLHG